MGHRGEFETWRDYLGDTPVRVGNREVPLRRIFILSIVFPIIPVLLAVTLYTAISEIQETWAARDGRGRLGTFTAYTQTKYGWDGVFVPDGRRFGSSARIVGGISHEGEQVRAIRRPSGRVYPVDGPADWLVPPTLGLLLSGGGLLVYLTGLISFLPALVRAMPLFIRSVPRLIRTIPGTIRDFFGDPWADYDKPER